MKLANIDDGSLDGERVLVPVIFRGSSGRVEIDMLGRDGRSIFGAIEHRVRARSRD